ncbi:UNVERIFIED_CONTAM: DNA mismatch repair protein, partial [Siphonaria sp. JEL0065]
MSDVSATHPIFLINISCDASIYDLTLDSEKKVIMFKNWDEILSGVSACTLDFLFRHELLTPETQKLMSKSRQDAFENNNGQGNDDDEDDDMQNSSSSAVATRSKWRNNNELGGGSQVYQPPPAYFKFLKSVKAGTKRPIEWDESAFDFHESDPNPSTSPQSSPFTTAIPITKSNLLHLTVIGQIDKKFIASWFPSSSTTSISLVIIDQHAADERVKLEDLFLETFGSVVSQQGVVDVVVVEPMLEVKGLGRKVVDCLVECCGIFKKWGIEFGDGENLGMGLDEVDEGGTSVLYIRKLPGTIAARCISDPELTKELLVEYLLQFQEACGRTLIQADMANATLGCPKGIIHLLNSKACRSAIMFGDELDPALCQTLVRNLKSCQYPFQCAHGRP